MKYGWSGSSLTLTLAFLLSTPGAGQVKPQLQSDLQITTKSAAARAHFEAGLAKYQTLHLQEAFANWRKATQEDPNFALAHIYLSQFSQDPAEQVSERDKALASKKFASQEEQLVIDWLSATSKGQWIPAIQAMNEVQSRYPRHKQVLWLAASWLTAQQEWGRSINLYERVIQLDAGFPDAWNSVAYAYARTRQFDKAFSAMQRYTELLPNEPNPQDSFAEISRMAGKYDSALEHYRASLKLDPTFIESQLGLGDTYALMGDEPRARTEYEIALSKATKAQAVMWALQSAATYVREGNYDAADLAFQTAAAQAHENGFGNFEAQAYRIMAMYQKDNGKAAHLLDKATAALSEKHPVAKELLDQELAVVLRTRIYRAVQDSNFVSAVTGLKQLEDLAERGSDATVRSTYNSAAGAIFLAQGKYQDAIAHLEEVERNQDPYALRNLVVAYEKNGDKDRARLAAQDLAGFNEPTIEQALVVPEFRKNHVAADAASSAPGVSFFKRL
jgi:tetratricopeptide (TPR) repeat protein